MACRSPHQAGLTLVELVVSMVITSAILFGVVSSILIAQRAMPDAENPAHAAITAGMVASDLATELQYAISLNTQAANTIEFTVADRNGDDIPETIRYAWSGVPGDPLTRQYNGGGVVNMLDAVQDFGLAYTAGLISEEVTPQNESAETLLVSYSSTQNLLDYAVQSATWYGQYILPSLPAGTASWAVTRIEFSAKASGSAKGECRVQIQTADGAHAPTGNVLEEKTLLEGSLTSKYLTQQFTFSNVSGLSPNQGLCIVVEWIADSVACLMQGQGSGVATPNSHLITSADQGTSWSLQTDQSLLFSVYGTVTTSGTPQVQNVQYLRAVDITLQTESDASSTVYVGARPLNRVRVIQ